MSFYRKLPVVIEAKLFDGSIESANAISMEWADAVYPELLEDPNDKGGWIFTGKLFVVTLEGRVKADAGDYIIKGVKGEKYPCKADIFEVTYEWVGSFPECWISHPVDITPFDPSTVIVTTGTTERLKGE